MSCWWENGPTAHVFHAWFALGGTNGHVMDVICGCHVPKDSFWPQCWPECCHFNHSMANLIHSAKSGSDWTQGDLDAYNIHMHVEDTATFFGIPCLPQPQVDLEILNTEIVDNMTMDKNVELINLLDNVIVPTGSEESAVHDFAVELFKMLGFVRCYRVARTCKDIPLLICGEQRHAKTDVCIIDCSQNDVLLLVQEFGEEKILDARAQLIAQVIAVFTLNNSLRSDVSLSELDSKVFFFCIFHSEALIA